LELGRGRRLKLDPRALAMVSRDALAGFMRQSFGAAVEQDSHETLMDKLRGAGLLMTVKPREELEKMSDSELVAFAAENGYTLALEDRDRAALLAALSGRPA